MVCAFCVRLCALGRTTACGRCCLGDSPWLPLRSLRLPPQPLHSHSHLHLPPSPLRLPLSLGLALVVQHPIRCRLQQESSPTSDRIVIITTLCIHTQKKKTQALYYHHPPFPQSYLQSAPICSHGLLHLISTSPSHRESSPSPPAASVPDVRAKLTSSPLLSPRSSRSLAYLVQFLVTP